MLRLWPPCNEPMPNAPGIRFCVSVYSSHKSHHREVINHKTRSVRNFEIARARAEAGSCVGCGNPILGDVFTTVEAALKFDVNKVLNFKFHLKCYN